MGVPEEIRNVERPINTVVSDSGRKGPKQYAVRERLQSVYIPGHNPQPRNGRVIGHIIDGRFSPVTELAENGPDMLSYGSAALVRSVTGDLMDDLLAVYPVDVAFQIMSIASLRVIRPSIPCNRISAHYSRTFVSVYYPGTALSKDTVCNLLQKLGQDGPKRREFFRRRIANVSKEHHIAVDGMLKQDNSIVNDLSAFSYKSRVKGTKDISVLYAYDIEQMEPVCAEVFPGNSIDASSYADFIRDNDIRKGMIVADKGFPPSRIKDELAERPDLHFITPVKRNDVRIENHKMLDFEGMLKNMGSHVMYGKSAVGNGRFLYAFRDSSKANAEESTFLYKAERSRKFDLDEYSKKDRLFGVMVLESDQDLPPETVYKVYDDRWLLELVFDVYKNDEFLDATNVQGDFSVIGSEFINFISTVATCRIIRKLRDTELLEKMSYGDLMDDLSSAWRCVDAPKLPSTDDGGWVHTLKVVFEELETLGLSAPVPKPMTKKRGRPKKISDAEPKEKRPRGRPRKNPLPQDSIIL